MNKPNGSRTPKRPDNTPEDTAERRRLGRIVHDDRGSASVEWRDAPGDYERPVLRVEGSGVKSKESLSIKNDDTFNPYDRTPDSTVPNARTGKRDLKKLEAWLKLMREMEERKKKSEDD